MSSSLLSMLVATMLAGQVNVQPTVPKKNTAPVIAAATCVSQEPSGPGGFDGRKDAAQRGTIVVGTGSRRLTIRGGLVPSPNVAAQASALDPARVAVASMPGVATNRRAESTVAVEFRPGHVQCP
jgi:hypothetical protein